MNSSWIVWLIVSVISFIIESMTVSLVTIWFGISGIITTVFAFFVPIRGAQIAFFVILSAVLIIFTRPVAVKFLKVQNTNSTSLIGETAVVTENIDNDKESGQVTLSGNVWRARSCDGEVINKEEKVIIKEIRGVTLIVERM